MNINGHLMYGGSGASNMVAKIISSNQRCFNLNKVSHPSAHLQRTYGDGSFKIDDSYWRQMPPPQRWDGGVSRNATPQPTPPSTPRHIFDTPRVEIPQPQFIQLTPQLSIPVQNISRQISQPQLAIAEPTPREDFQPVVPKLKNDKQKQIDNLLEEYHTTLMKTPVDYGNIQRLDKELLKMFDGNVGNKQRAMWSYKSRNSLAKMVGKGFDTYLDNLKPGLQPKMNEDDEDTYYSQRDIDTLKRQHQPKSKRKQNAPAKSSVWFSIKK